MTTEENFFVRQDVTGFFMMLQGAPGAGWGFGLRARGVDSGPGRGVGWGFGPRARGGDSGPGAGWELFGGKMGNFLPFCRFFAV